MGGVFSLSYFVVDMYHTYMHAEQQQAEKKWLLYSTIIVANYQYLL